MSFAFLYNLCRKALWGIALVLTGAVCLLNILYTSEVASTGYEYVTVSGHFTASIFMLVIVCGIIAILFRFREKLENVNDKRLFKVFSCIYAILAAYLIFNVDPVIRADAKTVFTTALEVMEKNYSAFQKGHYMYRYPHQLGLMTYDRLLAQFSPNPQFLFFVNFLLVLGINGTVWKISDELFHDKLTNVLTIGISFGFLPQFFFLLFAYGLIPGFFFMMLAFYCALVFHRTGRLMDAVILVLSLGLAVLLKQNFLIGGIAIIIFLFLQLLKKKQLTYLLVMAALILSMFLPAEGLKQYYAQRADVQLDNGSPTVLWIAMGTDIDNHVRGPGWYDSSSWNLYNESRYDTAVASELGKEKLAENWRKIRNEPARAGRFFLDKTISQWCDPMYESTWSGPLEDCGQHTHTDILQSLYTGKNWAEAITDCMKMLCLSLWILALAYLILCADHSGWEPMYLYFIGGLLFHTFWEGKSQYTYPYLFVLIPFAACSLARILKKKK